MLYSNRKRMSKGMLRICVHSEENKKIHFYINKCLFFTRGQYSILFLDIQLREY